MSEQAARVRAIYDAQLTGTAQVQAYQETDQLFPCNRALRGESVSALPEALDRLVSHRVMVRGTPLDTYLQEHRVGGLLVLKRGQIVFEYYDLGFTLAARWMSMSMAKSVTSTLIGAAIQDGYIASVEEPLARYLPELSSGAYASVNVRELLLMASGVAWNETYTDPLSDRRKMLELQLGGHAGSILQFMSSLPRAAPAGSVWNYSTGETHIAGALLCAAIGGSAAAYLSDKFWSPLGMQADASWWLEANNGIETGGSGLSATLRDYGRFAQCLCEAGVINGKATLPNNWLREATRSHRIGETQVPYGYSWWNGMGLGAVHEGAYLAAGIFGQFMYVHPEQEVVIVHLSAAPTPTPDKPFDLFGAIVKALSLET
jgi:CubicO group peptidase (beta-lactamase class C family)